VIILDEKTFYDRANFFLAAQAIFANAFATLAISSNLIGFYKFLPITICAIGISLNIAWVISGRIERKALELSVLSQSVGLSVPSLKITIKDLIYRAAPFLLFIAWVALLIFFCLQTFGAIKLPF
jgi:hypothetical protein